MKLKPKINSVTIKPVTIKPATMTVRGACDYTGLSKSTLYNCAKAKRLEIRKVGKRTLITTASLDKLLGVDGQGDI